MHVIKRTRSIRKALLLKLGALVLLILFALNAKRLSFPGFEGYVIDKFTGKPIEDAYVVSSTAYYVCCDAVNPGGGSQRPDSLQIAKTDKNGFFRMRPYIKFTGGWTEGRAVIIFKEGYLYPRDYQQCSKTKMMLSSSCETYTFGDITIPYGEMSLNKPVRVYLSNEPDPDKNDRYGSRYPRLLYVASTYHRHYKFDRKREFKKFKAFFHEVYELLSKHSDEIIRTIPEPNRIRNWQTQLKWYGDEIRGDDPIPLIQGTAPVKSRVPLHIHTQE